MCDKEKQVIDTQSGKGIMHKGTIEKKKVKNP